MLSGASLVYACFGALMASMAVLVQPISASLGVGAAEMGIVLGSWQFVYLFTAIPIGALLDRFGLRPCLLMAGVILASSAGLRAMADSYAGLLLAVMLVGIGGPLISIGAPKLVSRWFRGQERGLAMGIYTSSVGVGALLAIVMTNSLVMPWFDQSWHATFGFYGLVTLTSVVVWLAIISHPLSRLGQGLESSTKLNIAVFGEILRLPAVKILLAIAIIVFFFSHAISAWTPELLRDKGMTLVAASYWAGLPALIAIPAVLIIPRLATPARRLAILGLLALAGAVGTALFTMSAMHLLITAMVLQGIARGCLFPVTMLTLMEVKGLGTEKMGAASGLFFTAAEIGGVLGPFLFGLLIASAAGFDGALWLAVALLLVMLVLIASLRPRLQSDSA